MTAGSLFLVALVLGTTFMCGLNWIVQAVHYPLFDRVDRGRWTEFHREHSQRIGRIVGVPWALQGLGAIGLVAKRPEGVAMGLVVLSLLLAGVTVVATVVFALPAHGRLAERFDAEVHRRLVLTNWIRTVAWTAGTVVAAVMVLQAIDR